MSVFSRSYSRSLGQTAVYWGSPTVNGWGTTTFDDPVEIDVRWEERQELFIDVDGNEVRSRAIVYAEQDVDLDGYLYLGDLDDLGSAEEADPTQVSGAWSVRRFDKFPDFRNTFYIRKIWL
ncbi:MAG: hypothetical protein ACTSYH_03540 [Candidatus Heimdallarchaeaceae archaeon]